MEEFGGSGVQSAGEADEDQCGGVACSVLDSAEVRPVDACCGGQFLLAVTVMEAVIAVLSAGLVVVCAARGVLAQRRVRAAVNRILRRHPPSAHPTK